MLVYEYDGTFDGLLTVLYITLKSSETPQKIVDKEKYEPILFADINYIETDIKQSKKSMSLFRQRFTKRTRKNIFYLFLSGQKDKEILIYRYVKFGLQKGKWLDNYLSDKRVKPVHDISKKVGFEAHRMQGLIRFKELSDGMYYSQIETDHFILPLIGKHFCARNPDRKWIIHDMKRNKALIYDMKNVDIAKIEIVQKIKYSEKEKKYQRLWKSYFKHIAITERKNYRLQRQYMPKRYWKYLIEIES